MPLGNGQFAEPDRNRGCLVRVFGKRNGVEQFGAKGFGPLEVRAFSEEKRIKRRDWFAVQRDRLSRPKLIPEETAELDFEFAEQRLETATAEAVTFFPKDHRSVAEAARSFEL